MIVLKPNTSTILIYIIFITFFIFCFLNGVQSSLSDVTSDVFDTKYPEGVIAAFGDFDANKATDIFVLSNDGKSVDVYEAAMNIKEDQVEFTKKVFIEGKASDKEIASVVPGDFKYDAQMDVLVMRKKDKDSTHVNIEIYDGKKSKAPPYLALNETFKDQPVVIDANGDMIPDLFGETVDGNRAFWIFSKTGSYTVQSVTNGTSSEKLPPLKSFHSSAFLDLNGDLTADLCAVSVIDTVTNFEFWLNVQGTLTWSKNVPAPRELKIVGQASFVDFNGNHEVNIILPGCLDTNCHESAVFIWSEKEYSASNPGKWYQLYVDFEIEKDKKLSFPKSITVTTWLSLPNTLRIGDFNLDGFPDAVAIFADEQGQLSSHIMYNRECDSSKCNGFSRMLKIDSTSIEKGKPGIVSFFDLKENGVLDLVLTEKSDSDNVVMRAVEQDFTGDASFLKVVVVSGRCNEDCPSGNSPYGVNQVGPVIKFQSTTPTGGDQIGVASQMSQSSYFSLQLPFVVFGLGQTPNFVDKLEVGIPYPNGKSPRRNTWNTLIPNSQVIVIPHPVSHPSSWKHELYVTPSRLVLLTGVSLLGTCAFIALIVGLLHWRERREDKKEKLQESQRFHFDAM